MDPTNALHFLFAAAFGSILTLAVQEFIRLYRDGCDDAPLGEKTEDDHVESD